MKPLVNTFTKTDTLFFKGIGILMIVIHNYLHNIPGYGLENEASFNRQNISRFWYHLKAFTLTDLFGAVFGFLGHYGVQIFIVFSAYGLAIQFSKKKGSSLKFLLNRLKKVYFLMLFGIAISLSIYFIVGKEYPLTEIVKKFILLGTTISSFSKWYLYGMFSGPFWFFALIIQVYILFPFLYKVITSIKKEYLWAPFFLSYGLIYFAFFVLEGKEFNSKFLDISFITLGNIIGHLPEVFLGIAMAHFKFNSFKKPVFLLALLVFIGSQIHIALFPLSFLAASIVLIQSVSFLNRMSPKYLKTVVLYIGQISMILFVVNGPLRNFSYFRIDDPDLRALRIFVFLGLLWFLSHFLFKLYVYLTKRLEV